MKWTKDDCIRNEIFIMPEDRIKETIESFREHDIAELEKIGPDTPWEVIYRYFYWEEKITDVDLYIVQQLNLIKEAKAYKTLCDAQQNLRKALEQYTITESIPKSRAASLLYRIHITRPEDKIREIIDEIFKAYGFGEYQLSMMMGYDYSVINKVRNKTRNVPKTLLYALSLFLEYDLDQCEQLFKKSPHPLHDCFPDNIFRAYVKSENKAIQPFITIVVESLQNENEKLQDDPNEKQLSLYNFFKPEQVCSYVVISDFENNDGGYDFKSSNIRDKKSKMRLKRWKPTKEIIDGLGVIDEC